MLVLGGPNHFKPAALGAEECPGTGSTLCADPVTDFATPAGAYSFTVPAGSYQVAGFYELKAGGPRFLGFVYGVSVSAGKNTTLNPQVFYKAPATLSGKVTVTGVPSSDPVKSGTVLLCPSSDPYSGGTPSESCVSKKAAAHPSGTSAYALYKITGMPNGSYLAYPGYCAESGCSVSTNGVAVTLKSNKTTTQNLKTTFLSGNEGLIYGKVKVTGAPSGFSAQLGAAACSVTTSACTVAYEPSGGDYNLVLGAGSYTVRGFYVVGSSFAYGSPVPEVLTAGSEIQLKLSVPYQSAPSVSHG